MRAAAEAEDAEAGKHEHLQQQASHAGHEERHLEPAGGAAEVAAPEEQQEANGGDEAADADARRVQFDVERGDADEQQQHGHARRGQRPDQEVGPARLDQRRIVFQPVVLLELGEVLDDVVGQVILFGLGPVEFQRPAGRGHVAPLFPLGPARAARPTPRRRSIRPRRAAWRDRPSAADRSSPPQATTIAPCAARTARGSPAARRRSRRALGS